MYIHINASSSLMRLLFSDVTHEGTVSSELLTKIKKQSVELLRLYGTFSISLNWSKGACIMTRHLNLVVTDLIILNYKEMSFRFENNETVIKGEVE